MDFILFIIRMFVYLVLIAGPIAVVYLLLKIKQTSEVIESASAKDYTLLRILVPKQNDKAPQAAEEMFASIHGIFRADQKVQDHISFELAARDQYIQFFSYVPKELKDYIEGQIYAQYPTVEISEVQDYANLDLSQWSVAAAELILEKPDFFPIKTFNNFQVDPLAGITSVLSKIDEGEQLWVQILTRPLADTWQEKTHKYVKMTESGEKPKDTKWTFGKFMKATGGFLWDFLRMVFTGKLPEKKEEKKEKPSLPGPVSEGLRAAESKTTKLGFETMIRVAAIARDETTATSKVNAVLGAFKQFNVSNTNGFTLSKISTDKDRILPVFQTRAFPSNGYILNTEELASIFHLPSTSVETPSIVWAGAKKGEPPANLPIEGVVPVDDVTLFGQTNYRHFNHRFGIKVPDRRYHTYAIGKTGTGKSTMLRNMIIDDIQKGRGVCVVDPHGDLINHVLDYIPDHRVDDVVYFNPSDREHPIGFNLLESVDADLKNIVASGLMSIFTKLWANVWSARMEYILRNTVLALLEYPNATLLEIMKMLVDPVFRRKVLYYVKDPVIRAFFLEEYDKWEPKFRTEAIAALQNKIGQFLSSSTIRNIMGQIKSTINVRDVMDTGKIMLVDLSVGKIGEDNAALLGSMIITKIQLAAMGRADTPEDDRRDFYLYVDEFQNFATESFAVILSEARKYHLNLIITHQYIAQMPEVVASAVFGNVGTIIAFRVGASDATFLQKEFEPVFDANDLVNLDNYNIYLKMAIDARTAPPFSAKTLPPFSGKNDNRERSISESIRKYTVNRVDIEAEIASRNEANSGKVGTLQEVDGEIVYKEELKPYEPMAPLPKNETVNGVERWKIRDKEGKPYYVAGIDYDAYMEAKGKPSDRPGAVQATVPSLEQEEEMVEDAVLAVEQPIPDDLDKLQTAKAAPAPTQPAPSTPVAAPTPAAPKPVTPEAVAAVTPPVVVPSAPMAQEQPQAPVTPAVSAPAMPVAVPQAAPVVTPAPEKIKHQEKQEKPAEKSSHEHRGEKPQKHERHDHQDRGDKPKRDHDHPDRRHDDRQSKPHHPKPEHKAEHKTHHPAQHPSPKHDIVRHKIEEKYNHKDEHNAPVRDAAPSIIKAEKPVMPMTGEQAMRSAEPIAEHLLPMLPNDSQILVPSDLPDLTPDLPKSTEPTATIVGNSTVPVVTTRPVQPPSPTPMQRDQQPVIPTTPAYERPTPPAAPVIPATPVSTQPSSMPNAPQQVMSQRSDIKPIMPLPGEVQSVQQPLRPQPTPQPQPVHQNAPMTPRSPQQPSHMPPAPRVVREDRLADKYNDFTDLDQDDDADMIPLQEL